MMACVERAAPLRSAQRSRSALYSSPPSMRQLVHSAHCVWLGALTVLFTTTQAGATEPNPTSPPYVNDVYSTCSNCDGNSGEFLFWESSWRATEAGAMAKFNRENQVMIDAGRFPVTAFNSWSSPLATLLPGGSDYGKPHNDGKSAYAAWVSARPQYFALNNGGTSPQSAEGYISPLMPLDPDDCPPSMTKATYGDLMAERFGSFLVATGARGMFASDGLDELWGFDYDYNPRVIAAFSAASGLTISGGSPAEQAQYIASHHYYEWNEYKCDAFAKLYGDIAQRVYDGTGASALIGLQGEGRFYGQDPRKLEAAIAKAHGRFIKVMELQGDAQRELHSLGAGIVRSLELAAPLPDTWVGAQLSAPHYLPIDLVDGALQEPAGLSTVNKPFTDSNGTWPRIGLPEADSLEFMDSYLRGHWLTVAWLHIANRDGTVRRAMQFFHPYYNGQGVVPKEIEGLFRDHQPVRPFGNAFYFSQNEATRFEKLHSEQWTTSLRGAGSGATPVGFGVSDVSLPGLEKHRENWPTGFVVSDVNYLSTEELAQLRAIAPVYDMEHVTRIPSPLQFSGDVNGYGFVDQKGRAVIVASRENSRRTQMHLQGMGDIVCTVSFNGVQDGKYQLTDLFDATQTFSLEVVSGQGSIELPMKRWETRALVGDIPSPNGAYVPPSDLDQLLLHWKLDDSKGSMVAVDSSGSSRTGSLELDQAPAAWEAGSWSEGKFGGGLNVTQTETPAHRLVARFNYPSTNFTQSLWFNTTHDGTIYHVFTRSQNWDHPTDGNKPSVYVGLKDGRVFENGPFSTSIGTSPEGRNYADGKWHQLAVVRDSAGGKLYLDGELVVENKEATALLEGNAILAFGGQDYGPAFYQGSLDEIRLYGRALSADEVKKLYVGDQDTVLIPVTYHPPLNPVMPLGADGAASGDSDSGCGCRVATAAAPVGNVALPFGLLALLSSKLLRSRRRRRS